MVWQSIGALAGSALSLFGSKKSAEDSSALQYKYQSMLNEQNYNYNTKLINQQNAFNERMMDKANQWNLDRWNESVDLANTAHQREMADLKRAGLNPILSANGGASVVNPINSAQASSGNSQLSSSAGMPDIDYVRNLSTAVGMYQENRRVKNELKNSETQRDFVRTQSEKAVSDMQQNVENSAKQRDKIDQEIKKMKQDVENSKKITNATVNKMMSDINLNFENSAKSRQETKNLENQYKNFTVQTGFNLGKLGTFGKISQPNKQGKTFVKYRGDSYEVINGRKVKVRQYR